MIPSGSSSNTPLGVTTTTTETATETTTESVTKSRSTTPFCLGCGAWIETIDEMNVSPWHYCEWCTPKKPAKVRVTKNGEK